MTNRRRFLSNGALALTGLVAARYAPVGIAADFVSQRPPVAERKFVSEAVEATIARVKKDIADAELAWLFENCLPNTLDTTVRHGELEGKPDTFVITGDIEALWLRDSSAQVWPYLPLCKEDVKLKRLLAGVVHRQTRCILFDPYANAFNDGPKGSYWEKDLTDMKPELHERKWEIDSLCYPVRLAHGYWKTTGDTAIFDDKWREATHLIVKTFREQQRKNSKGPYTFQRVTSAATDTLPGYGRGNPTKPVGLIHSGFRPSDDACIYPFLIPSNLFAAVALDQLREIYARVIHDTAFAKECTGFAREVRAAVAQYARVRHLTYGEIYAYEVDGFGNRLFMDDSNVPSLLSLPYLGCCAANDPVYRNTRRFVLSGDNPYFFKGAAGEGIGGPHVGLNYIWPLAVTMRALTSNDDAEILTALRTLKTTHANTGFMHEGFDKDDPKKFTRKWFAWANTLFGELILKLHATRPHLLKQNLAYTKLREKE
jgi:hypothetical protein